MKKIIILISIFCLSCKEQPIKIVQTKEEKRISDSIDFDNKYIQKLRFKAKLSTVAEKVKLRNWVSFINSDLSLETKKNSL